MIYLVGIIGKSGTGKSTSIRTLPPEKTTILNVLDKALPFKDSAKMYNKDFKNLVKPNTDALGSVGVSHLAVMLKGALQSTRNIEYLVIDDMMHQAKNKFMGSLGTGGYDKFNQIASDIYTTFSTIRNTTCERDVVVFIMLHSEADASEGTYKINVISKLIREKYELSELFTIMLYTEVEYDDNGKPQYKFVTNHKLDRMNLEIPAKSPDGMFEDLSIPNDLLLVSNKLKEYYGI